MSFNSMETFSYNNKSDVIKLMPAFFYMSNQNPKDVFVWLVDLSYKALRDLPR